MNLVKIVVEVAKKLKGLEDDLLVAELLDVQLVEVVDSEVEQAAPRHVVVQEEVRVRQDAVVETWNAGKSVSDNPI